MRCGVQLCLRSYTLPVGRCSAWSDLRGAGELPGQSECASVASPAVDEKLSGTDGRKGGRMGEKGKKEKKEGGRNGRREQLEGAAASRAGRRGAEGGGASGELRPPHPLIWGSGPQTP